MNLLIIALIGIGSFFAGRYSTTNPAQGNIDELTYMFKKQLEETHIIMEQSRTLVEYLYYKDKGIED